MSSHGSTILGAAPPPKKGSQSYIHMCPKLPFVTAHDKRCHFKHMGSAGPGQQCRLWKPRPSPGGHKSVDFLYIDLTGLTARGNTEIAQPAAQKVGPGLHSYEQYAPLVPKNAPKYLNQVQRTFITSKYRRRRGTQENIYIYIQISPSINSLMSIYSRTDM